MMRTRFEFRLPQCAKLITVALGLVSIIPNNVAAQQWQNLAPMKYARGRTECALLSDGRIIVVGGQNVNGPVKNCEIYDPIRDSWVETGSLNLQRAFFGIANLPDGRILVGGGYTDYGGTPTNTCEIFDPKTGIWSYAANLSYTRSGVHTLTLPDSSILFIGGTDSTDLASYGSVDWFNPKTGVMTPFPRTLTGPVGYQSIISSALDGIVVAGAAFVNGPFPITFNPAPIWRPELYSFQSHKWTYLDSMIEPVQGCHQLIEGNDGSLLLLSGRASSQYATKSVQSFDPISMHWRTTTSLPYAHDFPSCFRITDDSILVLCGYSEVSFNTTVVNSSWYNGSNRQAWQAPIMNTPRTSQSAIVLTQDNETPCTVTKTVYVLGGSDANRNLLSVGEKLVFSNIPREPEMAISPGILFSTRCSTVDTTIAITLLDCSAQLDSVIAFDSSAVLSLSDTLPITLHPNSNNSIHIHLESPGANSDLAIRFSFSGAFGLITKFVHVYKPTGTDGGRQPIGIPTSLTLQASGCNASTDSFWIHNTGCSAIRILSARFSGADSEKFELLGDALNQLIAADDSGRIHIDCLATQPGAFSSVLLLHCSDGLETFDTTMLVTAIQAGRNLPLELKLSDLDNVQVGDTISVPIGIYGGTGESFNGFDLALRYNSNLLNLLPPDITSSNSATAYGSQYHRLQGGGTLSIEGPVTTDPRLPLVTLRFATQHADTNCSTLSITVCSFIDTSLETFCPQTTTLDSAQICLQSVSAVSESLPKHESNGIFSISFSGEDHSALIGYSATQAPAFCFFDELGRRYQPSSAEDIASNKVRLFLGAIPSGFYTLQMQDGSQSYSRGFVYLK